MTNYNNLYLHLMAKRSANKGTNRVKMCRFKIIRRYPSVSIYFTITINSLVIERDHR